MRNIIIAILAGLLAAGLGYAEQNKDADKKGKVKEMKRALLVIDVQNEYFTGKLPVTHPPGSLENIVSAMELARK